MIVVYRPTEDGLGNWFVYDGEKLAATFHNSEKAWAYVDGHTDDGIEDENRRRRIDRAFF